MKLIITTIVFLLAAHFLPGIHVAGFWTALLAALALIFLNLFVKPVLFILTLPVTILTLGLFAFIINALMIWLVSAIVPGFTVDGFLPALYLALIMAVVKGILHLFH